jgi:tetratricopeptide (TPR) repeat protein
MTPKLPDAEAAFRAGSQLPFTDPEAYSLLRKSHTLNPNDPPGPYLLAYICAFVGDKNLMEIWMQRAIDRETDTKRVRMMESERLVLRGDFKGALAGLRQLPDNLVTYASSVLELMVGCSERMGDFSEALQLASTQADKDPNAPWPIFHRAYVLRALGRESEAAEEIDRLIGLEKDAFSNNEKDTGAGAYLAFCSRFLGHKEDAYYYLRSVFPELVEDLPLLWANPALDIFAKDPEFQAMMSDFEKKAEKTRARIHDIEKT